MISIRLDKWRIRLIRKHKLDSDKIETFKYGNRGL